jgi:hypothetical protein
MKKSTIVRLLILSIATLWSLTTTAEEKEHPLTVHGFLTQAYVASNGNVVFGIPDGGTPDYRTAALQFRYRLNGSNNIVIQLSHERLGDSKVNDFQKEIELDWAFYQHSFNDATWIKAGRVQIPIGIYNEIRDVGTVLPFYRPSPNIYGDNTFTNETVDGVVGFHRFLGDTSWPVEVSGYYGGWNFIYDYLGTLTKERVENAFGSQIWVHTPITGLRFGLHAGRQTFKGGLVIPGANRKENSTGLYVSADGTFDKWFVRSEYRNQKLEGGTFHALCAQAGFSVTERIILAVQYDTSKIKVHTPFLSIHSEYDRDFSLSSRYIFKPNLAVNFENHWNRGFRSTQPIPVLGMDKPLHTYYFILHISASF